MEKKHFSSQVSRRQFIRQAACAAVGTAAMTSAIRDLRFMNAAVAQTNINDYKALICIFLGGGNDSNNLIIPTIQSEYDNYLDIRTSLLAIPITGPNAAWPIVSDNPDNHTYGFHPSCPEMRDLFNEKKLAVLFNTGTLVYPITGYQYQNKLVPTPSQLFSHADQVTQWQTSVPDQPALTGWGGRCADLLNSVQPGAKVSLSVSLAGANTFEVGNAVSQYSVSTSGAILLSGLSPTNNPRYNAVTNILGIPYANMQAKAYADVAAHSINTGTLLNGGIGLTADPSSTTRSWGTPFPGSGVFQVTNPTSQAKFNSNLGPQLKMIARLIEAGSRLVANGGFGMKRQIFFCTLGGYDTHTNQVSTSPATGPHSNLLAEVSQCLLAFQRAMEQIGNQRGDVDFHKRVTSFTCSDFGRTFPSNGQGTDHGWGSHHLILGGAVNGKRTYGKFPTLAIKGPDDTDTGRWIPSPACDQYFATLASWFGVDQSNLSTVFPNLGRFGTPNLGFV